MFYPIRNGVNPPHGFPHLRLQWVQFTNCLSRNTLCPVDLFVDDSQLSFWVFCELWVLNQLVFAVALIYIFIDDLTKAADLSLEDLLLELESL